MMNLFQKLTTQIGMTPASIAEACWEIACRDDVREAWEAVRPHDVHLRHALAVTRSAISGANPDASLTDLAQRLGEAADDIRRWADPDSRFLCERAAHAIHAAQAALVVVLATRAGDRVQAARAACRCARVVAEASITPLGDVQAELLARAERIAREPDLDEWRTFLMATGGEG